MDFERIIGSLLISSQHRIQNKSISEQGRSASCRRQNPFGEIPAYQEDPAGPHAGEAQDDQRGDEAAHAPPDSPAGEMAGARRTRLIQLSRRIDELSVTRDLPSRGR